MDISRSRILASDDERDAVALALRQHLAEGRLSLDEFTERVGGVYSARTRDELELVQCDLPQLRAAAPSVDPRSLRRHWAAHIVRWSAPSLLAIGVWVAAGRNGSFWPVWIMLVSAAVWLQVTLRRHR